MNIHGSHILTVNAGSSSIKLALFEAGDMPRKILEGEIDNIGQSTASLVAHGPTSADKHVTYASATDHVAATQILYDWLKQQAPEAIVTAIGHRIVHGGPKYYIPQVVDDRMLSDLHDLIFLDPEHLPAEIQLIEKFQEHFPDARQVACFDTAFHHDLPTVARLLPIPRHFEAKGIRRYGFHGLSYAFIVRQLHRRNGAADGKVIIAHLGSGASLAAVRDGVSIDTTMGLTAAAGVPMSTRSGDIDPGLALYLSHSDGYDAEQFNHMVNSESGLLGISETSADMKHLLEHEADDDRAKDAVDIFCYQVMKSICGLAGALGGLDTLIFTGGMGENAPKIRARICENLGFIGVAVENVRNMDNAPLISPDTNRLAVRVMHTDESAEIAQNVWHVITST